MSSGDTNSEPSDRCQFGPLDVLPPGHLVAEFRIERVLGTGGFGIVYLAFDTRLERLVAIKEFMPRSLAQRLVNYSVEPRSERYRKAFELGLRSFIKEARSLAKFKHPALVEVHRFWEELGTAYIVMPFYEGQTLQQRLEGMAAAPPEQWLRELMERVLQGLDVMHQQGWLHRDIAPDNILLLPGDRPLLLDFGSAKQESGNATQALAGLLKPGFAPFEQYSDSASLKQGPWTDLYALGAMLYYAISGRVPLASVERVNNDAMASALEIGRRRYSTAFLQFIDHCLAVWPEQRPRSITAAFDLLRGLDAQEKVKSPRNSGNRRKDAGKPKLSKSEMQGFGFLSRVQGPLCWAGGIAALVVTLGGLARWEPWSRPTVHTADKGLAGIVHSNHSGSTPSAYSSSMPASVTPDKPALPLSVPQTPEMPLPTLPAQFASPAAPENKKALSPPPLKMAKNSNSLRVRQAAAKKAECESLAHLLSLDGNTLAQRRFAQLGCRR